MTKEAVFFDLRNHAQINWFNKIGNKIVKWVKVDTIYETKTNEPVGYLLMPIGLFSNVALKKAISFLGKTEKVSSEWLNQFRS